MKGLKVFGCAGRLALMVAATGASAQEGEAVKSLLGSHRHHSEGKAADQLQRARAARPAAEDGPARSGRRRRRRGRNGNWPKDPDVAAAPQGRSRGPQPVTSTEALQAQPKADRLSIEEMRAGRNPNNTSSTPPLTGGRRPTTAA